MTKHVCSTLAVSCIDFRFQDIIETWLHQNVGRSAYDRVALAGGVRNFAEVQTQVDVSVSLHHIRRVVLINHEDCGAYGQEGTRQRHREDLILAKEKIRRRFNQLVVETYYLHLDGKMERID